ncbi:hypothetical protein CALVIDRAFT_532180 [Calocera viscosa TUFC12733]|uniref:Uncharacterized protein n=1 Tax=Calocera viscosa (strain TUFC12733) TaxID=1330018 RepID=A0A167RYP5_CALVF|nr:hypothetical protein CALVIDRAFT_532180 [Calocera viscosa TUFC12733]
MDRTLPSSRKRRPRKTGCDCAPSKIPMDPFMFLWDSPRFHLGFECEHAGRYASLNGPSSSSSSSPQTVPYISRNKITPQCCTDRRTSTPYPDSSKAGTLYFSPLAIDLLSSLSWVGMPGNVPYRSLPVSITPQLWRCAATFHSTAWREKNVGGDQCDLRELRRDPRPVESTRPRSRRSYPLRLESL